jgi:hypothetical protein
LSIVPDADVEAEPLAARDVLVRHYSRERLLSVARRGWIEPDLAPLP